MPTAVCHCGAVSVDVPDVPETLTDCNCSLCRRTGALWAYYTLASVRFSGHPDQTEAYLWGDKMLRTVRCKNCGIVTHWEPVDTEAGGRMGVNARNFAPSELENVRVRRFDGANTWQFLD